MKKTLRNNWIDWQRGKFWNKNKCKCKEQNKNYPNIVVVCDYCMDWMRL